MNEIHYRPIGIIHSPFTEPQGTPIQPASGRGVKGTVELFPAYVGGLLDIEGFSHLILLYHFHRSTSFSLRACPYLDDTPHGVFAIRSPRRPNPIGLSVVRLVSVDDNILHVQDLDIIDGTPLLDIKPFVPAFDAADEIRIGWLEGRIKHLSRKTA
ncbi:MAG: tRNA (N6-threonylcarbamoyladenosine(37)-N6)-methyltransferase TrmO [Candidatus Thermoplasmatota archaeon]|nr:tRNA (N6-threonylcarbamoyladenosine(37)-N6)-methyltransferase TrmO [Candidatus Thermoplasmatota archaeon]